MPSGNGQAPLSNRQTLLGNISRTLSKEGADLRTKVCSEDVIE